MDLSTEYLGLKLRTPLVPSASPLSEDVSTIKSLEDAGAAADGADPLTEAESVAHLDDRATCPACAPRADGPGSPLGLTEDVRCHVVSLLPGVVAM